jgi:hypothetical protein
MKAFIHRLFTGVQKIGFGAFLALILISSVLSVAGSTADSMTMLTAGLVILLGLVFVNMIAEATETR